MNAAIAAANVPTDSKVVLLLLEVSILAGHKEFGDHQVVKGADEAGATSPHEAVVATSGVMERTNSLEIAVLAGSLVYRPVPAAADARVVELEGVVAIRKVGPWAAWAQGLLARLATSQRHWDQIRSLAIYQEIDALDRKSVV